MKHDISPRVQVQLLMGLAYSVRASARIVGKSTNFVERWRARSEIKRHQGSGFPVKLTRTVLNQIKNRTCMKKRVSSRLIARQMGLSQTSVINALHSIPLYPYHPRKRPLLTQKHKKSRRIFQRLHNNEDWRKVLFIDEKKCTIIQKPNSKNDIIWAPLGTVIDPTPTIAHPLSLNIAAGVCYNGKTKIFIFKENMDGSVFKDILRDTIIPAGRKLLGANWKLYMDNDPKHTSKQCRSFLHENHIPIIPTPACSPDLNIQENVWSMLVDNMKLEYPKNETQLRNSIKKSWDKIPLFHIQNAVDSMKHRLQLVKRANGSHIK
jgi:transposase